MVVVNQIMLDEDGYAECPDCGTRIHYGTVGLQNLEKRHCHIEDQKFDIILPFWEVCLITQLVSPTKLGGKKNSTLYIYIFFHEHPCYINTALLNLYTFPSGQMKIEGGVEDICARLNGETAGILAKSSRGMLNSNTAGSKLRMWRSGFLEIRAVGLREDGI